MMRNEPSASGDQAGMVGCDLQHYQFSENQAEEHGILMAQN